MRTRLPTANDEWNSRLSTGPAVWRVGGDGVRVLHLAENLRLADDERVEAGGDAEQMARDVEIGDVVDVRRDVAGGDAVEVADEAHQILARRRAPRRRRRRARRGCRSTRTTASRVDPRPASARSASADAARLEIDPLAQLDRRGAVTDSDQEQMHLAIEHLVRSRI